MVKFACLRLVTVTNSYYLSEIVEFVMIIEWRHTDLAVLHNVELTEPCLIKWIAGGVYNMA